MRMLYEHIVRPLLFRLWNCDPERAHEVVMSGLAALGSSFLKRAAEAWNTSTDAKLRRELFGLTFRNPVGLAAGFDKNAHAIGGFEALGFGFLEIGTVTRFPQPGNERPRLFRLPLDEGVINRMGFNNEGADAVAARLAVTKRNPAVPLGISLGKSKVTPLDGAVDDYMYSFRALYPYGDYFAINVSSPNTAGLRQLQEKAALDELISALREEAQALAPGQPRTKPLLVKIAPDLEPGALDELLEVCTGRGVDGLIAVNTTLSRERLRSSISQSGGLSGKPLRERALKVVRHIRTALPNMPIIGVGGIMCQADAIAMLDAGADLLQLYTGLIYHGPGLIRRINKALVTR